MKRFPVRNRVHIMFLAGLALIFVVGAPTLAWFTPARFSPDLTVIDFEDLPPETTVTTQYGPRGVLFFGSFIDRHAQAHSGDQVLIAGDPGEEFNTAPLVMEFTSKQQRVRFYAGRRFSNDLPWQHTLRAYDQNGVLVAQDGPKTVTAGPFATVFQVTTPTAMIVRLEFHGETSVFEAIDDLEFEGEAPEPVPTTPPVVQITAPADNVQLDAASVTVQGTVAGEKLYPSARATVRRGIRPGSSTPSSYILPITLGGSGNARNFAINLGLWPGPYTVTMEAENIGALNGSDTVSFTNLPAAIRARFASEGGASTFGQLVYGDLAEDCTLAVYERGAIALQAGTTRLIRSPIFAKWLAMQAGDILLRDLIENFDCPTAEARTGPGGSRVQEFPGGRIYANLPTGAHWVPQVFTRAIDTLGGESATGAPIADPTHSIGVMQTWLFQQFARPDRPTLLPSTLEIRGTPPKLWIERQGGDLADTYWKDVPIGPGSPTIWQGFSCSGSHGPCNVVAGTSLPPVADPGNNYCEGTTYPFGATEWPAIRGDYVLTPMMGVVSNSHLAGRDNPLAHECRFESYIDDDGFHPWPSDWNVDVRPFHPYRNLFANNRTTMEIEFEWCWAQYFFAAPEWGEPHKGDLLFTAGRWIIDCGHDSYNSEIHPPSVLAYSRTETVNNRQATAARIWVNGVYPGDPVEFDLFPPPRPSPEAVLNIRKPVDADAALGLSISHDIVDNNHAHLRFTAPNRRVEISDQGQVMWASGRAYYGRWDLYWTPN